MRELTFGYSPCPNDTFAFHALTFGLIDTPIRIAPVLLDIEELLYDTAPDSPDSAELLLIIFDLAAPLVSS
jgi:predicted solute-binding protein